MLRSDPDAGLSLLRVAFTRMPVHDLPLARYGSLFPKEIAALIAGLGGRQRIALTVQALKRLDASTLCELLAADALPNLHEVFPHLDAGQRDALYRQGGEAWREHSGALPLAFVQALSSAARQTEARHAFSLRLLAAEPMAVALPVLPAVPGGAGPGPALPVATRWRAARAGRNRGGRGGAVRGLEPARHPGFLPRA